MVWSVTTSPLATYWWLSQGSPLCFAVIHVLCSGVWGVSCPHHTTTPSSVPARWCQTQRRREYDKDEERWVWCEDGGDKKDEGVKKHTVCAVETSGWKRTRESIWGRYRKKKGRLRGGGGIVCVYCLSAQWIIRKWTLWFRAPITTCTAPPKQ